MSFLIFLIILNIKFWRPFQHSPMFLSMLPNKIFSTLKLTTFSMYFSMSSNIIFNGFNLQGFDAFYCLKKENFHVQYKTLSVSNVPFQQSYYLLVLFCRYFVSILFFFFSFFICHSWCCLGVFILLTKLRSFSNQNIGLI